MLLVRRVRVVFFEAALSAAFVVLFLRVVVFFLGADSLSASVLTASEGVSALTARRRVGVLRGALAVPASSAESSVTASSVLFVRLRTVFAREGVLRVREGVPVEEADELEGVLVLK